MSSGSPQSQGGFYSAFPHRSNVGARPSAQAINVTPVPVAHPENEIQYNMVASQYPGELGVAYSPARWQKSFAQSQQNSQGLHHQQESVVGIVSSGSQPPIMTNPTTDLCSPAHISAQHSGYFGTSVNGYSVRQSVNNGGQQRECSKGNCSLKGSYLNKNTGQGKHLNSAALQGDRLEVAQTFPPKVQCSSLNIRKNCPLIFDLLTRNPSESNSSTTTSSSPEATNMALNTAAHFPGRRRHKGLQVTGSLASLNGGQTRTQHLHSGGAPSTPHQQTVAAPSLTRQPSTDKVLSVGETEPPTNVEIHAFIANRLAYFCDYLTQKKRSDGHSDKGLGRDSRLQSMQSHLPTTSTSREENMARRSLNCAVAEACSAAVGQAFEEDRSKGCQANAELMPQFNGTEDCATSASEKHSTGILVTAVENSKHSLRNESGEKSALVVFDLSVKNPLDVSMPANSDCKLVYSDDCEDTSTGNSDESFHSKWCDKYLKELIAILEIVESIAETENVSKVILQQYWNGNIDNVNLFASTEYPQIMLKVAATCTKNEDESPGVLSAVPGMTWDDTREKQPTSMLNRSSSQEECLKKSLLVAMLNSNKKTLDDINQVPGVSWALNHMTEREKGCSALKPVETVGLDRARGMAAVSKDLQTSSVVSGNGTFGSSGLTENRNAKRKITEDQQQRGVASKEATAHSELNLVRKISLRNILSIPTKQSERLSGQTSREGARKDVSSACSQTSVSRAVPETKLQKPAPLCESKVEEARPLYEDISDDDPSQLATDLPNMERGELSSAAGSEGPQYKDISEAESQAESKAIEKTIPSLVAAPNNRLSPFENGGYEHVQGQARMKTDTHVVAQGCSCSCLDDVFEIKLCPKCECGRRTNPSGSCSPSSVLKDEDGTDDEMDDDHLVIPISIFSLQYETDGDSPETNVPEGGETGDQGRQCGISPTSPNLAPATAFPPVPVFDTQECFLQAVQSETVCEVALGRSPLEHVMDSERDVQTPRERRESIDSCDTEDSCDYSSASECNFLTVSREMLRKSSALVHSETDDPQSEEEGEGNQVTDMQEDQPRSMDKFPSMQKPGETIEATADCSERDDIIVISDTEDESDQKWPKMPKRKRKRLVFSDSEDSDDAPCSQQKRHSTGTVPKKILKEYGPSEEKLQETRRSLLHREQLVGIKAGSEHELHKANRQMTPVDSLCGTAETNSQKNKLSSEVPTEEQRVMEEADSHSSSHPGISRLFVNPFGPKGRLKLLNEPRVHTRGKDGTRSPETSSKKTDSCEKNRAHLYKNKQRRFLLTPRPVNDNYQATKNKVQANVRKPAMVARQLSLPNQGLSPSEETASSSGLPSIPRQHSFPTKLQRSHSSSGPSTSTHTPTKGPASTMQSNVTGNTKEQVNSHRPIRRDRNDSLEMQDNFRRGPGHHHRASGDRAPRRRPNSHKPATTLMKRATNDAKELTRATNRFPPKKTRYSVGEGYKWSEPKPTKGSSREEKGRAPPRHYL